MSKKIAIMIPCYNEEITIGKVVKRWKNKLPQADVYVYDNNSSDRTMEVAKAAGAIVRSVSRKGKGNVVKKMFKDNDAECLIMVDGDNTYSETEAERMVYLITKKGYDMVVGDRLSTDYFKQNKKISHSLGNVLVNSMIRILFNRKVNDTLSGCRAFSRDFVKKIDIDCIGFEVETEITIKAILGKWKFVFIPIKYNDREKGSKSKIDTYDDGMKILVTILKMRINKGDYNAKA